jgi:hypothetical protein
MREYAVANRLDVNSIVPLTFVVSAGKKDREIDAFRSAASRLSKTEGSVWIVKPGMLNRGRGIEVFNSVADVEKHLSSQALGSNWVRVNSMLVLLC